MAWTKRLPFLLCSPTFLSGFHSWHLNILEFAVVLRRSQIGILPTVTDGQLNLTQVQCLLIKWSSLLYNPIPSAKRITCWFFLIHNPYSWGQNSFLYFSYKNLSLYFIFEEVNMADCQCCFFKISNFHLKTFYITLPVNSNKQHNNKTDAA